jgi:hypothetical protein
MGKHRPYRDGAARFWALSLSVESEAPLVMRSRANVARPYAFDPAEVIMSFLRH